MIYTVTCNPALDYAMCLNGFAEGETNRSVSEYVQFGGKGINVSVVLSRLGVENIALGFVAGFTGEALEKAVRAQGVSTDFIRLQTGMTRINVKLKGDTETEINASGPAVDTASLEMLMEKLDALQAGDTLVLAGSVPGSIPKDIYAQILKRLYGRGVRFAVDATGETLRAVLPFEPFLVKPNLRELEELCARSLSGIDEVITAAKELQAAGAQNVLVSLGGDGALLADANGDVHIAAACKGTPVNTVGAGDSMVAGFLVGIERGYAYALALGTAAGGATAFGEGLADRQAILELLKECLNVNAEEELR